MVDYQVIRTDRRTLALEITSDLRIVVRAPRRTSEREIAAFVSGHTRWIEKHLTIQKRRADAHPEPSGEEVETYVQMAKEYIPGRVKYYSALMGVTPSGISITGARTRFGSCSGKNRLSFSWRLMQYPTEAVDYVVVHELAHIKYKNHQREFYDFVARFMPDYKRRVQMLRE